MGIDVFTHYAHLCWRQICRMHVMEGVKDARVLAHGPRRIVVSMSKTVYNVVDSLFDRVNYRRICPISLHGGYAITPKMYVQIVSDCHGVLTGAIHGGVLVLAGDITNARYISSVFDRLAPAYTAIVMVTVNHEYYGLSKATGDALVAAAKYDNVHVLNNSSVIINGQRFVGGTLWSRPVSDKGLADFRNIEGCTVETMTAWNTECRDYLDRTLLPDDIVVTHFMPVMLSQLKKAGHVSPYEENPVLDRYFGNEGIDVSRVKLWIFGHTHTPVDVIIDGCRLLCNPVGYPGERKNFTDLLIQV